MTVFLRFGDGVLVQPVRDEQLGERILYLGRVDEEVFRQFEVAVVLEHAGVDDVGARVSVERGELLVVERHAYLDGAVAAEVEEDDRVAVGYSADGLAVIGDDERGKVLIDDAGVLGAVCFDRFGRGGKLSADASDVGIPADLYHIPVRLVAVHRDLHSAAAGSDPSVEAGVTELREHAFKLLDVDQRGGGGHVSAVEQDMHARLLHALFFRLTEHREKVRNVGMDVAVGEQTDEMQG